MGVWSTTDIAIAAYLFSKGKKLLSADRSSADGRTFSFSFEDDNESCDFMMIQFANSESRRFDAAMRTLKNIVINTRGNRNREYRRK